MTGRRAIGAVGLVVVAALWLGYRFLVSLGPAPPRNLVLISVDTLTPRRMGVYGGPRDNTPAIAALAARGVRFTNAFSPASWTIPGHAAMLSGTYPSAIQHSAPRAYVLYQLAPRLLAEYFQAAGFQTVAFTGGGGVSKSMGVDRGFDTYDEGTWSYVRMPNPVQWIRDHGRERPFFYFYHTYVVHVPYKDQRYAKDLPAGRFEGIWQRSDWDDSLKTWTRAQLACCGQMGPTEVEREYLLARYDGGVAKADEVVGEIWSALGEIGVQDETAVIITSDHGEEFWEHTGSGARHGHSLYDEVVRVPLIWMEPGIDPHTSDVPVSLIDLVPTILARFRLTPMHRMDGRDLSPILDGGSSAWSSRSLFAECIYTDAADGPLRWRISTPQATLIYTPEPAIQRGRFRLPLSAPLELYLPDDRAQAHNRAAEKPDLTAALAVELEAYRKPTEIHGPHQPQSALPPELVKQLRALGYLQ